MDERSPIFGTQVVSDFDYRISASPTIDIKATVILGFGSDASAIR